MANTAKNLPGINIQWPWSELLLSGKKSIETRSYALPKKFIGVELAVIETPGPRGKKEAGIEKARIVGTIVFSESFPYTSKSQWKKDFGRHRVDVEDPQYSWEKRSAVFGWKVASVKRLKQPKPPPLKRGIVFAKDCQV